MALNTSKCNHLMPLGFKGLTKQKLKISSVYNAENFVEIDWTVKNNKQMYVHVELFICCFVYAAYLLFCLCG